MYILNLLRRSETLQRIERSRRNRQIRTPPRRRRDRTIGPPDFVGVGVQRAGTTWWYELMVQHPEVERRFPKELRHFDPERAADPGLYARFFPRAPGRIVGEWTPGYIASPTKVARLAEAAPRAKLLVLIRDPVERYRSGLNLIQHLHRGRVSDGMAADTMARGFYSAQFEVLFEHFPSEQVLILQHEACSIDPLEALRRTFGFIGVEPGFTPRHITMPRNESRPRYNTDISDDERQRLIAAYEEDVMRLDRYVPHLDLSLWSNFGHLAAD